MKKLLKYLSFHIIMVKNTEYIAFDTYELYDFDMMDEFFSANPIVKATMLSEILVSYILINKNILYLYDNNNVTYKRIIFQSTDYLTMIARKFILDSLMMLSKKQQTIINKMYNKDYEDLKFYQNFILDLYYKLVDDSIVFDVKEDHHTHFQNGYFNVLTKKLYKRNPNKHYITEYIEKDYVVELDEDETKPKKKVIKRKPKPEPETDEDEYDDDEDEEDECENRKQFAKQEVNRIIDLI